MTVTLILTLAWGALIIAGAILAVRPATKPGASVIGGSGYATNRDGADREAALNSEERTAIFLHE